MGTDKYDDLVKTLKDHYDPPPSFMVELMVERYKFTRQSTRRIRCAIRRCIEGSSGTLRVRRRARGALARQIGLRDQQRTAPTASPSREGHVVQVTRDISDRLANGGEGKHDHPKRRPEQRRWSGCRRSAFHYAYGKKTQETQPRECWSGTW